MEIFRIIINTQRNAFKKLGFNEVYAVIINIPILFLKLIYLRQY